MNKINKQYLNDLYLADSKLKYPSFPDNARPPYKPIDNTANGLTAVICNFLNWKGHQAERVSSMGRSIDTSKQITDCIGRTRTLGGTKYIPSNSTKGTADISATINGKSIKIEVKIGKDRQSQAQKKYQINIEQAGGVYLIAKDFDSFINDYHNIIMKTSHNYKGFTFRKSTEIQKAPSGRSFRLSGTRLDLTTEPKYLNNLKMYSHNYYDIYVFVDNNELFGFYLNCNGEIQYKLSNSEILKIIKS